MISSCRESFPPSDRYLKALISMFVNRIEENGGAIESDDLAEIIFETMRSKAVAPNPGVSSYLSFYLPIEKKGEPQGIAPIRIRQFPFHNDVSLRLWEAGACLAEYFLVNKHLSSGKKFIELGAGVGLTGIVVAGCCGATAVHLTDYTDECLLNMEHTIATNEEWLKKSGHSSSSVTQGYLEWSKFLHQGVPSRNDESSSELHQADILLAADVIYDRSVIESLVAVTHTFLLVDPDAKEAIFAITKRNLETFEIFLKHLNEYDIYSEWIADGEKCTSLPLVFKCKFNQERSDVRIVSLKMKR
ncbi:unnamed protein product [Cylindrotheca closterium]|uniref:Calmodulin-lysine N-methyltransferase n=1 Tax=Cylindrotheca closterium TaxID=2856 RepID=A0AAD2CD00_9STRA|nr:unnamed protein product [Cylindrotheca closterium]